MDNRNRKMGRFMRLMAIDIKHCLLFAIIIFLSYNIINNKMIRKCPSQECPRQECPSQECPSQECPTTKNDYINLPMPDEKQVENFMDGLALAAGTDKASYHHHFTRVYPKYFEQFQKKPIRFLELGIYRGSSVKLWEDYFPNADLHFMDFSSANIVYFSKRSNYHFGNLSNVKDVKEMAEKVGPFDIIIDDGGHTVEQVIPSFETLLPYVKPGGIYVIEDTHTSYIRPPAFSNTGFQLEKVKWYGTWGFGSPDEPKAGPGTIINYFKDLIDDVNFVGAATYKCKSTGLSEKIKSRMSYYSTHIESIHFYSCLCFILVK